MLSIDLVHLCNHELPTREEKRENKFKKVKQNIKQRNVKIQYKKRPCFPPASYSPGAFVCLVANYSNNQ